MALLIHRNTPSEGKLMNPAQRLIQAEEHEQIYLNY